MVRKPSWSDEELRIAVAKSYSYAAVIRYLGLVPAGGNYAQIQARITVLDLDTTHFTGSRWNTGRTYQAKTRKPLEELLCLGSTFQSHKLKQRLFQADLKKPQCELCGWAKQSQDGRIPVELDHINGDHSDNRIENLRILCPNCHSLQPTHRGRNKKVGLKYQVRTILDI